MKSAGLVHFCHFPRRSPQCSPILCKYRPLCASAVQAICVFVGNALSWFGKV